MVELRAYCKINLGLRVVRRRADGFHDIETVMMAVPGLFDTVSVEAVEVVDAAVPVPVSVSVPTDSVLEVSGLAVDCPPEKNICMKALRLLQREYGAAGEDAGEDAGAARKSAAGADVAGLGYVRADATVAAGALAGRMGEARVRLRKVVPSGAGLGGGSADGAAVLVAANDEFALGLSTAELESLAARLGSDVPFFVRCALGSDIGNSADARGENAGGVAHGGDAIRNRIGIVSGAQLCTGSGEVMTPANVDLVGMWLAMVKPPAAVSTAEAYAGVIPREGGESVAEIVRRPVAEWRGALLNDFEDSVFARHPEIGAIKRGLYDAGAVYASMSGSGSALFGLFESRPDLSALEQGTENTLFIHIERL